MTDERRPPVAFPMAAEETDETERTPRRQPRALTGAEFAEIRPAEIDVFDMEEIATAEPPPALPPKRRSHLGRVFLAATGVLVSMAIGLWTDRLIRDLFERADWLGWTALALAAVAVVALVAIVVRETISLTRLASVERMRARAADVLVRNDPKDARTLVDDLARFLSARPETAAGRRSLSELRDDVIDGPDLVRLAETELLVPLDRAAQAMILNAGKRVSMVTAVSPRAAVDLFYVLFESARLIRRIAELYGTRPGTLGFFRLAREVLAHLAVTGSIAAGDSIVQQLVGHGLAARLSAKLGEGVVNGMMTVRIGIAAMETARPLPFEAVRRPGMADFVSAIANFTRTKQSD
ncbi:YcjF family protein [Aquibium oceanicum]|uniref:TIGR01620 family protein n=1 Tax=Aquibium oceanicum TaxID=1670800 RepID=A0A1L3SRT6_9HYPH|nr:TIGR01620 family protein [Aquibium oceanicum]APH72133.1 TIGR01620 family protein [Aquibium oceanicum]